MSESVVVPQLTLHSPLHAQHTNSDFRKQNPRSHELEIPKPMPTYTYNGPLTEEEEDAYTKQLQIQGGNMYKLHLEGDDARELVLYNTEDDNEGSEPSRPVSHLIKTRAITEEDKNYQSR